MFREGIQFYNHYGEDGSIFEVIEERSTPHEMIRTNHRTGEREVFKR